jgi:hypothetical protein
MKFSFLKQMVISGFGKYEQSHDRLEQIKKAKYEETYYL